jgi:hypothetical protein
MSRGDARDVRLHRFSSAHPHPHARPSRFPRKQQDESRDSDASKKLSKRGRTLAPGREVCRGSFRGGGDHLQRFQTATPSRTHDGQRSPYFNDWTEHHASHGQRWRRALLVYPRMPWNTTDARHIGSTTHIEKEKKPRPHRRAFFRKVRDPKLTFANVHLNKQERTSNNVHGSSNQNLTFA